MSAARFVPLTHSTSWSAGIVGAPVTDWRDYDSVYTERLMKMPQHNADVVRQIATLNGLHTVEVIHTALSDRSEPVSWSK